MALRLAVALAVLLLAAPACSGKSIGSDADADDDADVSTDTDGDTITDADEGAEAAVDTDGDTVPDFEDEDSDGDTIPDMIEACDMDRETPPVDSDEDGIPNFRDLDSDGNGIPDAVEGVEDTDEDGVWDFIDPDNDADGCDDDLEVTDDPESPDDWDGDTVPDYKDTDSDNDTIRDLHERWPACGSDVDGDTIPDFRDLDSDGDGWLDSEEAGDGDTLTPPVDSDHDLIPDFIDFDSDCDGFYDAWELDEGTARDERDTDADGVWDLIEVAAGSDPLDPLDNDLLRGHFQFVMRWNDPTEPPEPPLLPRPEVAHLVTTTGTATMDISVECRDDSGSEVDACTFIDRIEPRPEGGFSDPHYPDVLCETGLPVADSDGDTTPDTFTSVPPDTVLCFDIFPALNDFVVGDDTCDVSFHGAALEVLGDGTTVLDTRGAMFIATWYLIAEL